MLSVLWKNVSKINKATQPKLSLPTVFARVTDSFHSKLVTVHIGATSFWLLDKVYDDFRQHNNKICQTTRCAQSKLAFHQVTSTFSFVLLFINPQFIVIRRQ